jgi:pimeloyl-ACP methyl ester carboxylesterase
MRRTIIAIVIGVWLTASLDAASVDGIRLHSTSAGSGATIVFVHGWTCDTTSWTQQVPAFEGDYRVITLDLPGHGRSGSPGDGRFSMDLFARAVEAVRAEAGADRIVLVGHSMGVPVIRQYAIAHPDRVAGLVAVDGPLDLRGFGGQDTPPATVTRDMRETMIRGMFVPETSEALRTQIMSMMMGAPEATANGAMAAMFDPSIRGADVIRAPALAVYAGTAQVPDRGVMREVVPDVETTQVAGTGHFLMLEKPGELNRLLRAFLDRIDF